MAAAKSHAPKKAPAKAAKGPARAQKPSKGGKPAVQTKTAARPKPDLKVVKNAPPARTAPRAATELKVVKPAVSSRAAVRPAFSVDHLHQVDLVARDLDAAVTFYGDVLGLPMIARFDQTGFAFFDLGNGLRLLLSATASGATLYFYVKNLEAAYAALARRGVSFLQKPAMIHRDEAGQFGKKGGQEWMAFFRDPSGNTLALVSRK